MANAPVVDGGLIKRVTMVDAGGNSVAPSTVSKDVTFVGNNTAGIQVPLFTVTGSVEVTRIYAVVTTTIGANHTAAYLQLNDGAATPDITLATGVTVSNAGVGSVLLRDSLVSVALKLNNSTAAVVKDPVAATAPGSFMPFVVTAKVGATTTIEYVYTTTSTPTTGAATFYVQYRPLSANGTVTAI